MYMIVAVVYWHVKKSPAEQLEESVDEKEDCYEQMSWGEFDH